MADTEDTLEQAKAWAIQAQRQLDAAEALLRERRQKLREALALVAARESVALVGVPEPHAELRAATQGVADYYGSRFQDPPPNEVSE